jgi:BAI1-associated protein 3
VNKLLTGTLAHIEMQFKKIMFGVAERVRPELREACRECFLFLEDKSKTEEDALIPILTYLEDNIVVLHKSLLELNFVRVLQMFWNVTCQEMLHALKTFTKKKDVRNEKCFFDRLNTVIALQVSYFQGGGGGLNETEIDSKYYRQLQLFLACLSLPTDTLIAAYYREAAEEQMELKEMSKLGSLRARVTYHSGMLTVEVLCASNLSARDEPHRFFQCCSKVEASSDPQVEVSLMPPQNFPDAKSQKTEIIWKSQNPVFNQKFSWTVAEEKCKQLESVIVFTVRDYDRITRDDFLGQAVVPIAQMPGLLKIRPVAQPMQLQLRSVDVKHNPVLSILGSRKWDPHALNFVEEQHKRSVTIKDEPPLKLNR